MNPANPAIIFELKIRKKFNEMADGLKEAIKQIKDMKYECASSVRNRQRGIDTPGKA